MAVAEQNDWPDRTLDILVPTTILCVLSTAILIWRLVYGIKSKRKLMLCDYLLIIATIQDKVTTGLRFRTCYHGQGRHMSDPSIRKPYDILQYRYSKKFEYIPRPIFDTLVWGVREANSERNNYGKVYIQTAENLSTYTECEPMKLEDWVKENKAALASLRC